MAQINISKLADYVIDILPEANTLSCEQILDIVTGQINKLPENDEQYAAEVLCKSILSAAKLNQAKSVVDDASLKSEEVGDRKVEYATENIRFSWDEYIQLLKNDICPNLPYGGYKFPRAIGIKINPSEKFNVNPCCNISSLYLYLTFLPNSVRILINLEVLFMFLLRSIYRFFFGEPCLTCKEIPTSKCWECQATEIANEDS